MDNKLVAERCESARPRLRRPVGAPSLPATDEQGRQEPTVSLQRDDAGIVRAITVTCRCGETVVIDCSYPEANS